MAHTRSAVKRLRTSRQANLRNKSRINALKTFEKKFRAAVAAGEGEVAANTLKTYLSKLDKAGKCGVIHSNKVANKKSQLMKLMNTIQK